MGLSLKDFQKILTFLPDTISLESPLGSLEDVRLGDYIEDMESLSPFNNTAGNLLREEIEQLLLQLSPKERDVLRLRYGLDDGKERTLGDIGELVGVTREGVRQIEVRALKKLKQPSLTRSLYEYQN